MAHTLSGAASVELTSRGLRAEFSPEMGGRLLQLGIVGGPDILVPTTPHSFPSTNWPRAGAYPLVPYHNRLSDAQVSVNSERVVLVPHPDAMPHTLHGPGHTRPWEMVLHQADRLVMRLEYGRDQHWPWDFEAVQDFMLTRDMLKLSMKVRNLDDRPMPAGLGWHPYFASSEPVTTDANAQWPHRADYLPRGQSDVITDEDVASKQSTRYLQRWSKAHVSCSAAVKVTVSATPEFDFLVIHRGDQAHICVEPVTHLANAWNVDLDAKKIGARVLLPGETLSGAIEVCVSG